jgi:hypothetical protein
MAGETPRAYGDALGPSGPFGTRIMRIKCGCVREEVLTWLGDLDSNQGCPGQSREFYR